MKRLLRSIGVATFACAAAAALLAVAPGPGLDPQQAAPMPIDRHALVTRHNPVLHAFDPENPLTVGNGELAFTADATGLQTFPKAFERTIPLGTLSQWGWHTAPNPHGWSMGRFQFTPFDSHGRAVGYADVPGDVVTPEIAWLRTNPHRLHLGRIGLVLTHRDGRTAEPGDLTNVTQTLDLWNGVLRSQFTFDGGQVRVETACHPSLDLVATRVESPLLTAHRLAIVLAFPYGSSDTATADWTHPDAHTTTLRVLGSDETAFARALDADRYAVRVRTSPDAHLTRRGPHEFVFAADRGSIDFSARFSPQPIPERLPGFEATRTAVRDHWRTFWTTGGAIDLSASRDPRWHELERRIVLSQYLTAIQSAGSLPPQETGLTYNSWYGKFHLEMHWWHAVHFALWNRIELLERSLGYYDRILPAPRATAERQGYRGARWPKMTDPSGTESPSSIGPFLIWQQPHPIYYAELAYRAHPDTATLERYRRVVFESAEFMASFARDDATGRFVLGPPLHSAQEVFPKASTFNTTFELAYWRWGLQTAQRWRERLGLPREPRWDDVLRHLSPYPVANGRYLLAESAPDSETNPRYVRDHPIVLGILGMLPGDGVDRDTLRRTFDWVWTHWNWPETWGWDYGLVAMSAARLGEPARAVDALLLDTPKNVYRLNGHNHQRPGLTIYLPGNGALLTAAAMMAAGWDGGPDTDAPGFPKNGQWVVRWENLRKMP